MMLSSPLGLRLHLRRVCLDGLVVGDPCSLRHRLVSQLRLVRFALLTCVRACLRRLVCPSLLVNRSLLGSC